MVINVGVRIAGDKIVRLMFLYHITDKISHTGKYSRHLGSAMDGKC